MTRKRLHDVVAIKAVPAVLTDDGNEIAKGETRTVVRTFFYNGETWHRFTDKNEAPAVFFDPVR